MKKVTTIIAAIFLLFSASSFTTNDAEVSAKISTGFKKDFVSVSDLTWQKIEDVYIASFKVKDEQMAASYNEDGTLMSVSRYIKLSQLPLAVSISLNERYEGYTIDQTVIELFRDFTSYFIYAENDKCKLKIQADASGNFTVITKTKKK